MLTANPTPPREQPKTELFYTDEHTARRLGVSRPTAAKYKGSAFEKVRAELADQTEALIDEAFGRLQSLAICKAEGVAA